MRLRHWQFGALAIAAALSLVVAPAASAQGVGDRDAKEISSYRLTDAAFARYAKAQRNLTAAGNQASGDCDSDESSAAGSIDQVVARLNAKAGARTALQAAGMPPREYVVFSFSVFQAGIAAWTLDQPGGKLAAGVSMDNVNFYRKHEAALQKLGQETKSRDCDDGEE